MIRFFGKVGATRAKVTRTASLNRRGSLRVEQDARPEIDELDLHTPQQVGGVSVNEAVISSIQIAAAAHLQGVFCERDVLILEVPVDDAGSCEVANGSEDLNKDVTSMVLAEMSVPFDRFKQVGARAA